MFEENDGGVDDAKELIHAKRWDVYVNKKDKLVKGGYLVEVVSNEKKKVIWEVFNNHVIEEPTDHEEIVLQGFDFNLFDGDEKGVVREGFSEFPYLLMLIKIWHWNWKTKLKTKKQKVDEDNWKALVKGNVRYRKFRWFSRNEFWKNIGCLVSDPTFGLGGPRLWQKEEYIKISGNKRKIRSIQIMVYLYEVFLSGIIYCLLFYFKTILTPFFLAIFLVSLSLGEKSSESIGHNYLSQKSTRQKMNGGGQSC